MDCGICLLLVRRYGGLIPQAVFGPVLIPLRLSDDRLTYLRGCFVCSNVHTPLGAPDSFMDEFASVANKGRRTFSATAAAMDAFVANVTGSLGRRGLMDDATFVFTTDNGGNLRGSGK